MVKIPLVKGSMAKIPVVNGSLAKVAAPKLQNRRQPGPVDIFAYNHLETPYTCIERIKIIKTEAQRKIKTSH